jgi:hypothetical protein
MPAPGGSTFGRGPVKAKAMAAITQAAIANAKALWARQL